MVDLHTHYMGLVLDNPLIVASSGLTGSPEGAEKAAAAGAGAVVLKSLFEEQILAELGKETEGVDLDAHPEAEAFMSRTAWEEGSDAYLSLVRDSKSRVGKTPLIASINCVGSGNWASFASQIEQAGADALELNIAYMPDSPSLGSKAIEERVFSTVKEVRLSTKLPIEVKLGSHYSSLPYLAASISKIGANALVLFNRFYRLDIDIDGMKLTRAQPMSSGDEYHDSLRWTAILFQRAGIELCGATGIHDASTMAKFILAGASTVQICSAIYKGGWKTLGSILDDLRSLMEAQGFSSIDSMQGRLSAKSTGRLDEYMRFQYIKALTGIS
ncbi:MAG: dihydroorotate dehydrogenase-like protein [Spirochaetia bacterium]|nr:dihydroorotate dehydrogenase-like protein [Spirochaetia bacterium]